MCESALENEQKISVLCPISFLTIREHGLVICKLSIRRYTMSVLFVVQKTPPSVR